MIETDRIWSKQIKQIETDKNWSNILKTVKNRYKQIKTDKKAIKNIHGATCIFDSFHLTTQKLGKKLQTNNF